MQFELDLFLSPHDLDGVAEHVNQLIERPSLSRDAGAFEDASDVPIVIKVNGHMIDLHEIPIPNCSQFRGELREL